MWTKTDSLILAGPEGLIWLKIVFDKLSSSINHDAVSASLYYTKYTFITWRAWGDTPWKRFSKGSYSKKKVYNPIHYDFIMNTDLVLIVFIPLYQAQGC